MLFVPPPPPLPQKRQDCFLTVSLVLVIQKKPQRRKKTQKWVTVWNITLTVLFLFLFWAGLLHSFPEYPVSRDITFVCVTLPGFL